MKDVAPSTGLRRWFGHKPERWAQFRERYLAELDGNPAADDLRERAATRTVTLSTVRLTGSATKPWFLPSFCPILPNALLPKRRANPPVDAEQGPDPPSRTTQDRPDMQRWGCWARAAIGRPPGKAG